MLSSGISVESQAKDDGSILNVYRRFGVLRDQYKACLSLIHIFLREGRSAQQGYGDITIGSAPGQVRRRCRHDG